MFDEIFDAEAGWDLGEDFPDGVEAMGGCSTKPGVCIVVVRNDTPCKVKASIVGAAVRFFYSDGSTFDEKDTSMNLTCGMSTSFRSDDPNKCVEKTRVRVVVRVPGQKDQVVGGDSKTCGKNCWHRQTFSLGNDPAKMVLEAD